MMINKIIKWILAALVAFLLYLNIILWHSSFVGVCLTVLFFILSNYGYTALLRKFFNFSDSTRTRFYGVFLNFFILSCVWGAFIVFYELTDMILVLTLILSIALSIFFEWRACHFDKIIDLVELKKTDIETELPKNYLRVLLFMVVLSGMWYFLSHTVNTFAVGTPWLLLSKNFIYLVFLAIVILAGLMIDKFKVSLLLSLTIFLAFSLSAILPATSKYLYGADGWRHLAIENQILETGKYEQTIYGDKTAVWQKINPGRFSYSRFWGASVGMSKFLNISVLDFTRWFLPVIWAIFFVFLIYDFGLALGLARHRALFLILFALWPFALQAMGMFSLPVSLGFLTWLFMLLLLARRFIQPARSQILILFSLGLLLIFDYSLYLILFWFFFVSLECFKIFSYIKQQTPSWFKFFAFIASAIFLPAIELIFGFAKFSFKPLEWGNSLVQFVGNITGYYLASGPRPHSILTGNIFFYQTPLNAFVVNAFITWRFWIVILMVGLLVLFIKASVEFLREKNIFKNWLVILTWGLFAGYLFSRYFLTGENVLTRRLDAVLAVLFVVIVFFALEKYLANKKFTLVVTIIISVMICASFSLGPVSRSVSQNQFEAMSFVNEQLINNPHPCVVADTYPLLVLEAVSAKRVVGGGFPIDEYFAQGELTELYEGFLNNQDIYYFNEARRITGTTHCIFVVPSGIITEEVKDFKVRGGEITVFGNMSVIKL